MTSFFDRNIGRISGRVLTINKLCNELESSLDLSKPDYVNVEVIKTEASRRNITLQTKRAYKLLCRIKQKQIGWRTA